MQFSVGAGRDVFKYLNIGDCRARVIDHVEPAQQGAAIQGDIKNPRGFAAASHVIVSIDRFREIELQLIIAGQQRDIVPKTALSPGLIDAVVARTNHRVDARSLRDQATRIVAITLPGALKRVHVAAGFEASQNSHVARCIAHGCQFRGAGLCPKPFASHQNDGTCRHHEGHNNGSPQPAVGRAPALR